MYAKRKFLIDSNLSLNLQRILNLSRETPSPSASKSKANHIKVLSDLSLSCIHFWTVFFETKDFLLAGAVDKKEHLQKPEMRPELPAAMSHHVHSKL